MEFEPVAGAIGAEVLGVDLTTPVSDADAETLRHRLATHQALFFRDQPMAPADHRALAHVFGETQPHPAYPTVEGYPELSILEVTEASPPKIDTWHTDMTFMERPPLGSILHGRVIPPYGGDTLFASLTRAYETLSAELRTMLDGLEAEHSFAHGFRHSLAEPGGLERLSPSVQRNPPRRHPVVRIHPVSGAKALFVNRLFTTRILGIDERQSDALLRMLCDHIVLPEHTCRFRWRRDSVAIWDNRATQHRPVNDFWPGHRVMQRITIAGDVPV
ncbi:MAG: TauD/TfdA dioxygenase family protein [Sandaracinaceae bacterium]